MSGPPGIEEACEEIIALRRTLALAQESYAEVAAGHRAEIAALKRDYIGACELVAAMHAAAHGGEPRGPARGVVEDVQDLYTTEQVWRRAAEQAMRMWDHNESRADEMQRLAFSAASMAQAYILTVAATIAPDEEVADDFEQTRRWLEYTTIVDESPSDLQTMPGYTVVEEETPLK